MNLWTLINERELGLEVYNDKTKINENTNIKLKCYIKYLKNDLNLNKIQIRNLVDELMMDHYDGFIMGDWDETLQYMTNKYTKKKYSDYHSYNDEIIIYEEELKVISEIGDLGGVKDIEIEKVLFIMLILAKLNQSDWVNYTSRDIFKLSKYKYKTKTDIQEIQREKLIYDLAHYTNKDIFNVTNFGTSPSIKLLFIKDSGNEQIKLKVDTNNIEIIILEYLKWRNKEGYSYCTRCGKGIISKGKKPKKYCSTCSKVVKNEQNRLYYKRKSEKLKNEIKP